MVGSIFSLFFYALAKFAKFRERLFYLMYVAREQFASDCDIHQRVTANI